MDYKFYRAATTPLKINTEKDTCFALSGELSWDWKKALPEVFPSWDEYMNRRMGRLQKREQTTCWSTFKLVNLRWDLFTCFKPFQRLQRPQIVSQCIILFFTAKQEADVRSFHGKWLWKLWFGSLGYKLYFHQLKLKYVTVKIERSTGSRKCRNKLLRYSKGLINPKQKESSVYWWPGQHMQTNKTESDTGDYNGKTQGTLHQFRGGTFEVCLLLSL